MKKIQELLAAQRELATKMADAQGENLAALEREYNANKREIELLNQEAAAAKNAPAARELTKNQALREAIKAVREHRVDGDFTVMREGETPTAIITSGVINAGEKTNMESAGLPLSIKELINPLEMGLIYDKLGLKVATGVRGQIQWPYLANAIEASVGGELDEVDTKVLNFGKITATPFKLGVSVEVSNEAINDAAFDLNAVIVDQINKSLGRVLNKRVLALSAPGTAAAFVGPLVAHKQTVTFAATGKPTYKEIKKMKAKVLGTGAEMAGFCYVADAAMYSDLECTAKDAGSGRFVLEGGKIDGDPVFITNDSAYAGKVVAGCFAYAALNQHGATHFIIDPYTKAKQNVTVFTLNADFSLTYLLNASETAPFVVGA